MPLSFIIEKKRKLGDKNIFIIIDNNYFPPGRPTRMQRPVLDIADFEVEKDTLGRSALPAAAGQIAPCRQSLNIRQDQSPKQEPRSDRCF